MNIRINPWVFPETGEKLEAVDIKVFKVTGSNELLVTFKLTWHNVELGDEGLIWDFSIPVGTSSVKAALGVSGFNFSSRNKSYPQPFVLINGKYTELGVWDLYSFEKALERNELKEVDT